MGKIAIKDLCDCLKKDIDEKSLFFKELNSPIFLEPFNKENMFDFTDKSSYWAIQYLDRIYNENTKDTILEIINENIKNNRIEDIHGSTYYQLVKLLDKFDLADLNKLDFNKLLTHNQSIELVKKIYEKEHIIEYKNLIKSTIAVLLKYQIKTTFLGKNADATCDMYTLSEIINSEDTKFNFQSAISQDFIFDYLVKKYEEVYFKIHKDLNNIADVFTLQTINLEEMNKNLLNDYSVKNIEDIIIYFICVNLSSGRDISNEIKQLLSHRIFMLRKLGLYFIYENIDKYIDLLKDFFSHVNKKNIIKVTNICLYELVNIFKNINKIANSNLINADINAYLDKFPKKNEMDKYNVLHGLKEHPEFKNLFYKLKEKYKYEKTNPGIYWQTGVGGWVRDVSPISEEEFKLKSIKEQIKYVNQNIKYNHRLIQVDEESVEEVNERGLIDLFKKIVSKNINIYLKDENIIHLKKIGFILAFLEILSKNIEKITYFDKAILFIDSIFNSIIQDKKKYKSFLYELINFNNNVVNKRYRDFKKIRKYIENIAHYDYDENYYKSEFDISSIALNTIHGRNFACYIGHLIKIRKLNKNDRKFIEYILLEENEERFCSFYYYLGMQYDYLSYRDKDLHLLARVFELKNVAKKYFLNGYLSYFHCLPQFKDLKPIVLESFEKKEICEGEIRTRFVGILLDIKLKLNEDTIFEEFSKYFSEKDYQDILNSLKYRDNSNYSKERVMQFWVDMVKNKNKSFTVPLIAVFNRYCNTNDIDKYNKELKSIIELGFPSQLITHKDIKKFLENLLCCLQETQNVPIVYDIVIIFVLALKDVEYLYTEIDILIGILEEFTKQNKFENAKLIARKMYKIPCLKFYAEKYKKFLL